MIELRQGDLRILLQGAAVDRWYRGALENNKEKRHDNKAGRYLNWNMRIIN